MRLWRLSIGLGLLLLLLAACGKSPSKSEPAPPEPAAVPPMPPVPPVPPARTPPDAMGAARIETDPCGTRDVELVYALSRDRVLYSFDPKKLPSDPFRKIGALDCQMLSVNSMAVDHSGYAWIVDHGSQLYRASILDAHCTPAGTLASTTGSAPQTFGMGFASSGVRSAANTAETLYVSSDDTQGTGDGGSRLGFVDIAKRPPVYTPIGPIEARGKWNPELSGTGEGRLFGYFPLRGNNGFVQEIDRDSGKAVGKQWPVPTKSEVQSWAFATWGGTFYVFTATAEGNQVHAIHPRTGNYELAVDRAPIQIVGAGVSTCAPILEAP